MSEKRPRYDRFLLKATRIFGVLLVVWSLIMLVVVDGEWQEKVLLILAAALGVFLYKVPLEEDEGGL